MSLGVIYIFLPALGTIFEDFNTVNTKVIVNQSIFSADNPMELQLSWPSGYYSLFAAIYDTSLTKACPQGTGFQWRSGSITDQNHVIFTFEPNIVALFRIDIKEIGKPEDWENFGGVKYEFCTKTQDPGSQYFSQDWPKGRYCILRKSRNTREPKCPRSKLDLLYYC